MRNSFIHLFAIMSLPVLLGGNLFGASPSIAVPPAITFPTGTVQFGFNAADGTGSYTWDFDGTLPPGLALRTDVPTFPGPGQQTGLMGVATTAGVYPITLKVTSGGETVSQVLTITITNLNVQEMSLPDAFAGITWTHQLTTSIASSGVSFAASTGQGSQPLPNGMTISPGGLLSWPSPVVGQYNINFILTDGVVTVSRFLNLNVYPVGISTPGQLPNGTQNSSYSQTLTATGGGNNFSQNGGWLPQGLTLRSNGVIEGTITAPPGNYSFGVMVQGSGGSYTKWMSLDVIGNPPGTMQIQLGMLGDATVGDAYRSSFSVCCGGTAPFSWNVTGLPPGMSFRYGEGVVSSDVQPGSVEIYGVPQQEGDFTVHLTATDSANASATMTVPLHVSVLKVDSNFSGGIINQPYSSGFRVIGGTAPYSITLTPGSSLPAGMSLNSTQLTGTPIESGRFYPTFLFTDHAGKTLKAGVSLVIAGGSDPNTQTIEINGSSDLGQATVDIPNYQYQLNACCAGPYTWTVVGGTTLPPGITLNSVTGRLEGTPTSAGTYTFLIQADGATATYPGIRQFTLMVTPIVIGTNPLPYGHVGAGYTASLSATGGNGTITWTANPSSSLPPGITLNPNGTFTGNPTTAGQYSFNVVATDGQSTATQSYVIQIYAPGANPPVYINSPSNMGTWRAGTFQFGLDASGGDGSSYDWSLISSPSTLPPGLALRTDVPQMFSHQKAGLAGVTTTAGTYTFTLRVSSGGQTADQTFTLRITKLDLRDMNLPTAFLGAPYSYKFTPVGTTGTVTFSTTGPGLPPGVALPSWLTLSSDGTLSGTPSAANGTVQVGFNISDGTDTVYEQYSLNISAIHITTDGALPNGLQDNVYPNTTIAATGCNGGCRFTTMGGLPNGLSLSQDGTISGTINAWPGLYGFQVTAADAGNPQSQFTKTMSIDVVGSPVTMPRIFGYPFASDPVIGNRFSTQFGVCCGGTAPFNWTATGLPAGLSLLSGASVTDPFFTPGQAQIAGVPQVAGDSSAQVTVTDATGFSTSVTFPIHVSTLDVLLGNSSVNSLPNGTLNVPYTPATLRVLGGSGGYTVTKTDGDLPVGVTLNPSSFQVAGTPLENISTSVVWSFKDSAGQTLSRLMDITIDGGGTNTISIGGGGMKGDSFLGVIPLNQQYQTNLWACCIPTALTWSLDSGSLPPGITLDPMGSLSGTPTQPGNYVFRLKATDAGNPNNAGLRQFTLIVSPVSITTASRLPFANQGRDYSQPLSASGATGNLTWSLANGTFLPPGLILDPSSGAITGTPTSSGNYAFTVQVKDTTNNIAVQNFTIDIYVHDGAPPLQLTMGPGSGDYLIGPRTFPLGASGGKPPYHYSLTPGAAPVPGFRVQDGPPLPNFPMINPSAAFLGVFTAPGSYTTQIRVTDSLNHTFDSPVTLRVTDLNLLNFFSLPHATQGTPYSFALTPYGGSGSYTWSADNLPTGLTINSSGVLQGTPTASGTYYLNIKLSDVAANSNVGFGETLVVDPFAITDNAVLPQATAGVSYTHTFNAPGCGSNCVWTTYDQLPIGFSLSSNGTLTGVAPVPSDFDISFKLQASGTNGTVQKRFRLTTPPGSIQGLSIITNLTTTPTVGDALSFELSASGGTRPYTWSKLSGSLPTGMSLQGPGETISSEFVPGSYVLVGRAVVPGTYSFTLQVRDSANKTASKAFTWVVSTLKLGTDRLPVYGNPLVLGTAYTQPLLVMGGSGNYTSWTTDNGQSVYPGLTMDNATGVVSGTPTDTGSLWPFITVTDDTGKTLTANLGVSASSSSTTTITLWGGPNTGTVIPIGTTATYGIGANDGTGPYTFSTASPLPPGFALQIGNDPNAPGATLLVSPTAPGTYTFTVRATDSNGVVGARTYSIVVPDFNRPVTNFLQDGSVNVPYSQPIVAFAGAAAPTWALASGAAVPPGLSLSPAGVVSGTPTQAGNYSFNATISDTSGSATFTFSLKITGLAITNASTLPNAISGHTYTAGSPLVTMTASGGTNLIWSASGLPPGLSMSAGGLITGVSSASLGSYNPIIAVTSGTASASRTFTLYLRAPNPTELSFPMNATSMPDAIVGTAYWQAPTPEGGVPPYTWALASGSTLPPGLSLLSGSALPSNALPGDTLVAGQPTTAGQYTFSLVASDSNGASITRTFSLNVTPLNLPKPYLPDAIAGSPYSQGFSVIGGSAPYTFTIDAINLVQDPLPQGLSINASTGVISGTPTGTGVYTFRIKVQDSAGHNYTTRASLRCVNSKGLLVSTGNVSGTVGSSLNGLVLTVQGGNSTYNWSIVSGTAPPGLSLQTNGSVTGWVNTPGVYHFTLRATDTNDATNVADRPVTYTVSPIQLVAPAQSAFTSPVLPAGAVDTTYSFTFKAAGGTPQYTFAESRFNPLPPGLTLSSGGVLSGTPTQSGAFLIRPVVTDSAGFTMIGNTLTLVITGSGRKQTLNPRSYWMINDAAPGVLYATPLDRILEGGTPPYTWTVAGGSTLPDGLQLVAGSNGVPSYLVGVPAKAQSYSFSLLASDSGGQSVTVPFRLNVMGLAISPASIPPGIVDQSYTVTFTGGVPPNRFNFDPNSSGVPGLTLSEAGVLSGKPTTAGVYPMILNLTDGNGNKSIRFYDVIIDNVAGEVPAISVPSNPASIFYRLGDAAPDPARVAVNATSGSLTFSSMAVGVDGVSLTPEGGVASTTGNLVFNPSSGHFATGSYSGFVAVQSPAAVNGGDIIPFTINIAAPCAYAINPSDALIKKDGGMGALNVTTAPECGWTAEVTNTTLITEVSPTSGFGPATIHYKVPANTTGIEQSGSIRIGSQVQTIRQAADACSFAISPASFSVTAAGGSAQVSIIASGSSCPWTASGLNATPASGKGSGQVAVTIPATLLATPPPLTATIAGRVLNIAQTGVSCTTALGVPSASVPASGGAGTVSVTIPGGCSYTTTSGPSWISILSGGSAEASGTLSYSVDPNSTTVQRTGTVSIGGVQFQITQPGVACSFTLDTSSLGSPFDAAGGNGTIGVNANGSNCSWTASSNSSWAHVTATGSGSVIVSVDSNASATTTRTGSVTVAGQNVSLSQAGTTCELNLRSASASVPASGGDGSVGVVAPAACGWTAVSDVGWLTITNSGTGGTADVQFHAQSNTTALQQTGHLTITGGTATQTYTVTQGGAPCTYSLTKSGVTVAADGVTDAVSVSTTQTGCTAASAPATSYAGWITASNNSGVVTYTAAANPSGATRNGTVLIGDQAFTITQTGAACAYSLASHGALFGRAGGTGALIGSPSASGCSPAVAFAEPFLALGVLTGPVSNLFTQPYSVGLFNASTKSVRRGTITFGGQIFTVKQTSW